MLASNINNKAIEPSQPLHSLTGQTWKAPIDGMVAPASIYRTDEMITKIATPKNAIVTDGPVSPIAIPMRAITPAPITCPTAMKKTFKKDKVLCILCSSAPLFLSLRIAHSFVFFFVIVRIGENAPMPDKREHQIEV